MSAEHPFDSAAFASAALCGLLLGAACDSKSTSNTEDSSEEAKASVAASASADPKAKDCCMGLNDCKGKGGCAVPESHSCMGKNDCKGKGGCNMHCPKK